MAAQLRLLIADDQPLVRSGLRSLVDGRGGLTVVGEAVDGAEAHQRARELRPDVVLMDVRMPVLDGLEATRRILADPTTAGVRVVVLTTFDLDEYVYEALRAGASGFLLKTSSPEQIVHAVQVAAAGDALLEPAVTRRLIARFTQPPPRPTPDPLVVGSLTARELQVVGLVARGLSNTEIARDWVVSETTVRTHVHRAMAKVGARDRAQLVVIAYQQGLAAVEGRPRRQP